ncbi:soluble lamin-associated protein of 75 kDa isoform X2 [Athene cunicularia]|uniref:soluble lamin-associated protein of 75 kDa isoform X2 n=1 Tax=Athene cunicularia TaxID=194338 RepID=UPI000EF74E7D|nr:soluble lamin-associated protein of 75 kDa isoform X2 [Athene cunicularia]XP_026722275.1 soluble lamin-associated protein of 75 kDa isoform X2 [Athene cunicularia]XP_026722276.1 soluble lamin-associated protein of 75 kDa isoform X2 [Athene cunicularia]XP_026722278.1 soluble lamin-associated protein of 75 kDa isoform X2 [Athene cunicularia]
MSFPVDILNTFSHEDLESSAEGYLSDLRHQDPNHCEFLSLPGHGKVTIKLGTVGFVPLYGEEQTHKVLGLFAPRDSLTAVALYLANRWWSVDDVLRTSVTTRQGLHKVESVGERIVLYVLNRIIYRTQEMGRNEIPFLCHSSNDYAKILWKKGEAIGFYSVKPKGSICSSSRGESYKLSVLDTMFVRKNHRERESGLIMLEDFVDSFREATLGLRYPLSTFMYTACKLYLDKYPEDHNLLWEVEGAGYWFQKTSIMSTLQSENLKTAKALLKGSKSFLAECHFQQSAAVSEVSEQGTELQTQPNDDSQKGNESIDVHASTSKDPNTVPVSIWTRSSHFRCPKTGKKSQESEPGTSEGDKGNAVHVSESRMKLPAPTSESDKNLIEVPEDNTVEEVEKTNEDRSVPEVEQHVSPSEESSEKKDIPSEPLNGEITEEAGKTSLTVEEETANEVLSDESELQSESQGEEPLTLFVPLVLETAGKPSEDTVSEQASNINDSEMLTKEGTVVEKEGTEEQQESEKTTTENAAASTSKEETSNSGLPNPMVTEAAEESVSENVLPEVASSLEGQDEVDHNSQEAPVALSQSSLIVVELEGFSFQQPSGQEGQKNQLEEHSEEPPEQMDQHQQTAAERAADSSSEEAEVEIPIVDRRNLRRKAKCSKGPPKKKGKPA